MHGYLWEESASTISRIIIIYTCTVHILKIICKDYKNTLVKGLLKCDDRIKILPWLKYGR